MIKILITTLATIFLMSSCGDFKLTNEDVIGSWKSPDDAIMQVNPDSTFMIYNLPEHWLRDVTSNKIMKNVSGTWRIYHWSSVDCSLGLHIKTPEIYASDTLYFQPNKDFCLTDDGWSLYFKHNTIEVYEFYRINNGRSFLKKWFIRWTKS